MRNLLNKKIKGSFSVSRKTAKPNETMPLGEFQMVRYHLLHLSFSCVNRACAGHLHYLLLTRRAYFVPIKSIRSLKYRQPYPQDINYNSAPERNNLYPTNAFGGDVGYCPPVRINR